MTRGLWLALLFASACGGPSSSADDDKTTTDDDDTNVGETDTVDETDTDPDTDVDTDTDTQNQLPDDPCFDLGPPVLRVGTGEDTLEAVSASTDVYMVHGGQGGWHMTLALEVENAPPILRYDIRGYDVATGTQVSAFSSTTLMVPLAGGDPFASCAGGQYGIAVPFEPETFNDRGGTDAWDAFCGAELRFEVDISVPLGSAVDVAHVVSGEVRMRAQPDPCDCEPCGATVLRTCRKTDPTHPDYDSDYVLECLRPPDETGDTGQ